MAETLIQASDAQNAAEQIVEKMDEVLTPAFNAVKTNFQQNQNQASNRERKKRTPQKQTSSQQRRLSQMSAQFEQQKKQRTEAKNTVLSPEPGPPAPRPQQAAQINPLVMNPGAQLSQIEKQQIESDRKRDFVAKRIEARDSLQNFISPPRPEELTEGEGIEMGNQVENELKNKLSNLLKKDKGLKATDPKRQLIKKQMNRAKKQAAEQFKKIAKKLAKQIGKQIKKWSFRIFGRGSVVDIEGFALWAWTIAGYVTSMFEALMTLVPEKMKKGAGPIGMIIPEGYKVTDPFFWALDAPYLIVATFILLLIFLNVQLVLGSLGMFIVAGSAAIELYSYVAG